MYSLPLTSNYQEVGAESSLALLLALQRGNLQTQIKKLTKNLQLPISVQLNKIFFYIYSRGYSKALRCTFFGERKNSCSSKFVQLLLLNRVKARWSEIRAAQSVHFINSFISNFFGPNSKRCSCEVRAAQGRVSWGLTVHLFQTQYLPKYSNRTYFKTLCLALFPFHKSFYSLECAILFLLPRKFWSFCLPNLVLLGFASLIILLLLSNRESSGSHQVFDMQLTGSCQVSSY